MLTLAPPTIWMLDPRQASLVMDASRRILAGETPPKLAAAPRQSRQSRQSKVAMLDLSGVLTRHRTPMTDWLGGTSMAEFGAAFDAAVADPSVAVVGIYCNTPGGDAQGTPELSKKVFDARRQKTILSFVDMEANSAGYYIASAASKMYAMPSASTGSIGVWSAAMEYSKQLEADGVKVHVWRSQGSPDKAAFLPYEQFTQEAIDQEQRDVDRIYQQFVADVARNRGVSSAVVQSQFGQGKVFDSRTALRAGMIDAILIDMQFAEMLLGIAVQGSPRLMMDDAPKYDDPEIQAIWERQQARIAAAEQKRQAAELATRKLAKVEGLAAVFNSASSVYVDADKSNLAAVEFIKPGAFRKSLRAGADIILTVDHDFSRTIAKTSDGTLRLQETDEGLRFSADIHNTEHGVAVLSAMRDGKLKRCSFTPRKNSDRYEYGSCGQYKTARLMHDCDLIEICLTDSPAYAKTYAALV